MNTSIETQWIEVGLIDVPEYGRAHSSKAIEALAGDMTKNGQLQNAVVSKCAGDRFELVIGKGRLEAAKTLGWEKIRADVKEGLTPAQKLAMVAAENEAREDACPFYTAMLYQKMMQECGLTQEELGTQIGRDQPYVSRYLVLTKVPREIWNDHQPELTSMRLCLEIAKAKDAEHQKKLVEAAAKDGLGTAAVKKLAKSLKGDGAGVHGEPGGHEKGEPKSPYSFAWKGTMLEGKLSFVPQEAEQAFTQCRQALAGFLAQHPEPKKTKGQAFAAPDSVFNCTGTAAAGTQAAAG